MLRPPSAATRDAALVPVVRPWDLPVLERAVLTVEVPDVAFATVRERRYGHVPRREHDFRIAQVDTLAAAEADPAWFLHNGRSVNPPA